MPNALLIGIILFTTALLLYSIATWAGVLSGGLKKWHLILFWAGLVADMSGTFVIGASRGGFVMNTHSILGTLALLAMLAQNIGATIVFKRGDEKWIADYPKKISLPIWFLWMASFVTGLILSGSGV